LFSNEAVARYLNESFEAAWKMVRPVPIVRIDFGDGNTVTRTLRGNIASYVCTTDGQVVDILPGIYNPPTYQAALQQLRPVAEEVSRLGESERRPRLREYHVRLAERLRQRPAVPPGPPAAGPQRADRGKGVIELPLQRRLAGWTMLAQDSQVNERTRRLQIHQHLAASPPVRPEQIKHWLYREVLHADLNDRYLGLGEVLFGDEVVRNEERASG
jgi:hypothetical protein